ncbi:MAG: hypothetical protein WCT10_04680 [Patescibacteria group bacterium]|jgi:hypothetical protein
MIRFKAARWTPQELADRLCHIIYGRDLAWRSYGDRWEIGSFNDWWLHREHDGTFLLHYRHGKLERMRALAKVMVWLLGVKIVEIK